MGIISLDEYKELISKERSSWFISPYDLVYEVFVELGYDKKDIGFFFDNASSIVEELRNKSWEKFLPLERDFTSHMLNKLIDDNYIKNMTSHEAISWFVQSFPTHIYSLNLSNTQSRRSRAGKEFEAIIELLLTGAGIPYDSQGNIGKKVFTDKGLGKLVDLVSPGVTQYLINKRNTVLISAKTTLRERWQEVPEEMGRTGAREMFLATLDDTISNEVLTTLYEANIQVVTTRNIRNSKYSNNSRVLDFEKLIEIANTNSIYWDTYQYTDDEVIQYNLSIENQASKHDSHPFIKDYFETRYKP